MVYLAALQADLPSEAPEESQAILPRANPYGIRLLDRHSIE